MRSLLSLLALLFLISVPASAQDESVPAPEPRLSPLALAKTMIGDTYVKVHYSSPQRRHPETGETRAIFGGLVPFGEVWRTGANESTEITFTGDVMFGGQHVPAGTYALYTIPGPESWTVILSSAVGQWGSFSYDPASDVARVEASVESGIQPHEAFTIAFVDGEAGSDMTLTWEQTRVHVPIMAH